MLALDKGHTKVAKVLGSDHTSSVRPAIQQFPLAIGSSLMESSIIEPEHLPILPESLMATRSS